MFAEGKFKLKTKIKNTHEICVTDCVLLTTASESHPSKIAIAENGSMDSFKANTQVRKGAVLVPPIDLFRAIASSRLFFRIYKRKLKVIQGKILLEKMLPDWIDVDVLLVLIHVVPL